MEDKMGKLIRMSGEVIDDSSVEMSIAEQLIIFKDENNLSDLRLSNMLSMSRLSLSNILDGSRVKLSVNDILKISKLLNINPENLIGDYYKSLEEKEVNEINLSEKAGYIIKHFDLPLLKKIGFIDSIIDLELIEKRIVDFFSLDSVFDYDNIVLSTPLYSQRSSQLDKKESKIKDFWLKCNKSTFETLNNPNEYNSEELYEFTKRIKLYSVNEEKGFYTVLNALYKLGVSVIVQKYITKSTIFGASMIVNNKPCIVLTDQGKRYDRLWFTLLHEVYHILSDLETLSRQNYHLSDPNNLDVFMFEDKANHFASEILFGVHNLNIAKSFIDSSYKVKEFARELGVHSSIIYGQYLYSLTNDQQKKKYPIYAKHLISSSDAIAYVKYDPYQYKSINDSVEKINEIYNSKIS